MNKLVSLPEVVEKLKDGMTIMVGGFLNSGAPLAILNAIADSGVKNLTLICNDAGFVDKGVGKIIANGQVKKLITSYVGSNPSAIDFMNNSQMEVEFSPQGTLIERIRAAGAGLGGVLTPTGLGTSVENGKQIITVDSKKYLLETPLKADISLVGASISDNEGNLHYKGTTRNFNPMVAMAADIVIAEAEEIVETGQLNPDLVHTPAILIDFIYNK
ncbi:MAG: branched-chain amino acid dehydrogenase [Bacteroidetes bacterium HGW-Bacteroidetes-6]|jgi:acetate CoA/acetoacetate CoA-transferase alpha subunit|nr:MAG: branched-chain amino acid dehydrogenase [Bacteroidetes bacterium HGW-Bacteroidetes-7]PKP04930.1 MAG: branched-chain amino acid dehydrogenase [Bacteroidetes bacterium HGW-Bacteroidetes-6]